MLPETPPPDPASDFGIERTAFRMNVRDSIAGHGMRYDSLFYKQREAVTDEEMPEYLRLHQEYENALSGTADDAFADAVSEVLADDLANELPTQTLIAGKIGLHQRSIASSRQEKRRQQEIVALANAKIRQLTISMQADEAAIDSLLASEA